VLAVIAITGGALRIACVGHSCDETATAASEAPFCRLPIDLRQRIANGFLDGRSPDVIGVTGITRILGGTTFRDALAPPWPSTEIDEVRVPLLFFGSGVAQTASIPEGTGLDAVAPTIAEIIGLQRPHPEVRSGRPVPGIASGEHPRLVVLVVLQGIHASALEVEPTQWPHLRDLMDGGVSTLTAEPGSEPLDPTAIETTIGTGGLPRQHGITGTLLRDPEAGKLTRAWSTDAPVSVIAGLGDDLDELNGDDAHIGLVAPKTSDRGLIGGNWYVSGPDDDVVSVGSKDPVKATEAVLAGGFASDDIPDLLGVVLEGSLSKMDAQLPALIAAADQASQGSVAFVVTATGGNPDPPEGFSGRSLGGRQIPAELDVPQDVIEGVAVGGLYLDQAILAEARIPERDVVAAMLEVRSSSEGERVFVDAFPAIAVSLGRYC
jgi:Type I phosphodiesterase / nucleotide pyrophosphatase